MRPRRLVPLLALALLGVPAAARAATSYQGDPAHTGHVAGTVATPPALAWSRELDGDPSFPIVLGDRVFTVVTGDADGGTLYALDRTTGQVLWRRAVATGTLAEGGGRLYVVSEGALAQAIDPATGDALWTVTAGQELYGAVPVAGDDRLYALVDGAAKAYAGTDGTLVWSARVGAEQDPPALDATTLYGSGGGYHNALSSADGTTRWETQFDYDMGSGPPVVHGGRVWTNTGRVLDAATDREQRRYDSTQPPVFVGGLAVLSGPTALTGTDEATGEIRWVHPVDGGVASPPLAVGGTVFAVSGAGRLEAVDAATGGALGGADLPAGYDGHPRTLHGLGAGGGLLVVPLHDAIAAYGTPAGVPLAPPPPPAFTADPPGTADDATAYQQDAAHSGALAADTPAAPLRERWARTEQSPSHALIADGKVFTVTYEGQPSRLRALDARDGHELWSAPTGRYVEAAYEDGRVFTADAAAVRAFAAGTGALLWVVPADSDAIKTAPIALGGVVYTNRTDGIIGYREADGTPVWRAPADSDGPPASDGRTLWAGGACGWVAYDLAGAQRIAGGGSCVGAQHGFPWTAMGGGLAAEPASSAVLDSATARARDALWSHVVPAFAHGLRFSLDGRLLDAAPAAGGPVRWRFGGDGALWTPPLVVGRQVFIASETGRVYALDADTGARLWTGDAGGALAGDPSLAAGEGTLVVPTAKQLVAFESAGGAAGGDGPPPQTTVDPVPSPVRTRDVAVGFRADATAFFDCRLDGGDWEPCTSPHRFLALADGTHTAEVRAIDAAGVADPTPARTTFTLDAPPDTWGWAEDAETNDPRQPVDLRSDDEQAAFECRLDGGGWAACDTDYQPPAPLADGDHTLEVRAVDAAGQRDPTPAVIAWHQDTVPPSGLTIRADATDRSRPQLSGTAASDGGAKVRFNLYYGTQTDYSEYSADVPVTPGEAYSAAPFTLDDGTYTVVAQQWDAAANAASAAVTLTVTTAVPDTRIEFGPSGAELGHDAIFDFASTHHDATYQCSLDGGAWAACSHDTDFYVSEGPHRLLARAVAADGTVDPTPASRDWRVDTTAPQPAVDTPAGGGTVTDPRPLLTGTAGTDPGDYGDVDVSVRHVGGGSEAYNVQAPVGADGRWRLRSPGLPDGTYTVSVVQTDGYNEGEAFSGSFTVAGAYPATIVPDEEALPSAVTGDYALPFRATEADVRFECRLDAGDWTPCTSSWMLGGLPDGDHTVSVRAIDDAGHVDPDPPVERFTVDGTPPAATLDAPADQTVTDDTTVGLSGHAGTAPGDRPLDVAVYLYQHTSAVTFSYGPVRRLRPDVAPDGTWSATVTLPPGHYQIEATQFDELENFRTTPAHDIWIDDPPPTGPTPAGPAPTPTATPTATASPPPTATPPPTGTTAAATESSPPASVVTPAAVPPPSAPPAFPPPPAEPAPASPTALARALGAALRTHPRLPATLRYRAARAGTLTVRLTAHRRLLAAARVRFRTPGERPVTLRGRRLPRRFVLEVRWARGAPVRRSIRLH